VRRAIDLSDGSTKVIKLEFREEFDTRIGDLVVRRFRSPRKEAHILDLVRGHPHFMTGRWVSDAAGNNVRILDFIRAGATQMTSGQQPPRLLPPAVSEVLALRNWSRDQVPATRAKARRHQARPHHLGPGAPHHPLDRLRLRLRARRVPVQLRPAGPRQLLIFLAGRKDVLLQDLRQDDPALYPRLARGLTSLSATRVVTCKICPYIPESLSGVLLHFSGGDIFCDAADQLLEDLAEAQADVTATTGRRT
jgi:hypothetical protein